MFGCLMRHCERESNSDRGVHRIAARPEHRHAGIGGVGLLRDNHGVPCAYRLACESGAAYSYGGPNGSDFHTN